MLPCFRGADEAAKTLFYYAVDAGEIPIEMQITPSGHLAKCVRKWNKSSYKT